MSSPPEPRAAPPVTPENSPPPAPPSRRADVDAKQAQVAALLRECNCDSLLLLQPENVAWLTAGLNAWSVLDPEQAPAIFCSADYRWVVSGNFDSQRIFDEDLAGLGFQLKEWAWSDGRDAMLQYLARGKRLACDRAFANAQDIGDRLREMRCELTDYEIATYRHLGATVSHALEAACRTLNKGDSELEIAGQLAHRLLHRGAEVVKLEVTADERGRRHRRPVPTAAKVAKNCVLTLTGRQAGLHVTASRSMCFGSPDPDLQREHAAACKITASYIASSWPDAVPGAILATGRRVYKINLHEHEWRLCPAGHLTGRRPVERLWTAESHDLMRPGWPITWYVSVGGAVSCDTFLITNKGPLLVTKPANWPQKRIRIQGANLDRPDLLQR